MTDRCNYTSEIDMDGRMLGGEHKVRPYDPSKKLFGNSRLRGGAPIVALQGAMGA